VAVAVSVVVAQQKVSPCFLAALHKKRLVHGREQILRQLRRNRDQLPQRRRVLRRRQPPHQVERTIERVCHAKRIKLNIELIKS
jgi:hypothetical protein